jgi:rare lipoprotein A
MHKSSQFAPAIRGSLMVVIAWARRNGRLVVPVVLAVGLGACAEVRLAAYTAKELVAQVEKPEPRGDYKVGDPYQINGEWYRPAENPEYDEVGVASWYGEAFHGRPTANGSTYDMNALTAAHKTLPMPSMVHVTNLENGRSLTLTVNDRGPFVPGRVIDVSRRASQLLGFHDEGTAQVRVRAVRDAAPAPLIQVAQAETDRVETDAVAVEPLQIVDFADIFPAPPPITPAASAAVVDEDLSQTSSSTGDIDAAETAHWEPLNAVELTRDLVELEAPTEPVTRGSVPGIAMDAGPVDLFPETASEDAMPATVDLAEIAAPQVIEPDSGRISGPAVSMYIQAGSFTNVDNAQRLSATLARLGPAHMTRAVVGGREFYRVRIGPIATLEETNAMLDRVIAAGYPEALPVAD